jgi:transcription elongation GreA/GreB family factor
MVSRPFSALDPGKRADNNLIFVDRPLARALIGATIDETVELDVSGKTTRMVVEQIYPCVEAAE